MKKLSTLFSLVSVCIVLLLSGCGGKNVTGTLTMTAPTVTNNTTFSQVASTITYTNPDATNVGNVVVNINGAPYTLPNNGSNTASVTVTYLVDRDPVLDKTFTISASTGDLVASVVAVIPKQTGVATSLTAAPTSIIFLASEGIGTTHTVTISGGTLPYITPALISPTPNANLTANVAGNTLTLTRQTIATGSATVVVLDSASPQASVSIPVTLQ